MVHPSQGMGGYVMTVSDWAGCISDWSHALADLKEFIAPAFKRSEQSGSAGVFIDGLLSGVERKTGWMLAEEAGLAQPYRIQSLLGRSSWSADTLCELVRSYAIEALGDPDGVLVVDETGFLKKGTHSVGVARQYSGTAGRIENCQIGVFVAYASRFGQALIDRRLYLPDAWAKDTARRTKTQVPDDIRFATKPEIARELIASALDAGARCRWVLADAVYGSDYRFRRMLQTRGQPYVLAVRSNHLFRIVDDGGLIQTDAATLVEELSDKEWTTHAAGEGSKGLRLYDWARVDLTASREGGFERWLLVRRSRRDPAALAYYVAFAPA